MILYNMIMEKEFIEECWFIYGIWIGRSSFIGHLVHHSAGTSGSVDFDWKESMSPRLLGWLHSHPPSFGVGPSDTDESAMRGWVRARNDKLICGISSMEHFNWLLYFRRPDREIGWSFLNVQRLPLGMLYGVMK